MGTSEAVLQVFCGAVPRLCSTDSCFSKCDPIFSSKYQLKCRKRRVSRYMQLLSCSGMQRSRIGNYRFRGIGSGLFGNMTVGDSWIQSCKCQQAGSISGATTEDENGTWFLDSAKKLNTINNMVNAPNALEFQDVQQLKQEKEGLSPNGTNGTVSDAFHKISVDSLEDEAWDLLRESMVYYCGSPVGTIAAKDPTSSNVLNYDQVFIRDFIPSGIAFLLKGEYDIVRNFILHTLQLQSWEKTMDCHSPGQGLMPASFKVRTVPLDGDESATEEVLDPDFGEAAIGRVAPVDSGLWWIILLRAYGKCSGDLSVQERVDVQTGIKMILRLCLADGFDMFPTLLVTDGSCMIDRRMGIHGHPLEIQSLFYSALLCAREMLAPEDGSVDLIRALNNRLVALSFHIREYYWVDLKKLNEIYRYKTEEYSYDAVNKFNIYPDQISSWLVEWMPNKGGYLIGNLQPAHMDFRFFSLGNLWSVISSIATTDQSHAILDLIESKWGDLVADMPFKICYPALEGQEWQIITGSDPKNTPWSYHNAGSWPTLLWQLTVASIKMNRPEIAAKAVEVAEKRISRDKWPEYYDTKRGRFIGKQARLFQTWSIAGYLVAKLLLADPSKAKILTTEEDSELVNAFSCMISANPRRKPCYRIGRATMAGRVSETSNPRAEGEGETSSGIRVHGMQFSYDAQPPLFCDFNLNIAPGSRCLLVGANGSGKTTLLKILAGKQMVGGRDVVRVLNCSAFHDTHLVCSGDLAYLGGSWSKSVGSAGELPLQGDFSAEHMIFGVEGTDPVRRDKLIELLDINLQWRMHKVSDGQRRRVQICMGLLHPFKVLLLDEVTVDLDVVARLDLLDFFKEECEQRRATIVYATHIFDGLETWATHLAYIQDGELKRAEKLSEVNELKSSANLLSVVESWLRAETKHEKKRSTNPPAQTQKTSAFATSPFMSSRHMAYYR